MNRHEVQQLARYMRWQETATDKSAVKNAVSLRVLKPLREWLHSLVAVVRKQSTITPASCDVLLLHYSVTSQARGYRDPLVARLRGLGLIVTETAIHKPAEILASRLLVSPGWNFLHRYYLYAAYAKWIVTRYQPTVILTDKNGSVLAPFLKAYLKPRGTLVHVAHSIPTDNFRKFSMNDYDYYFLFGQSSLERLQRRPLFGNSLAVLTGSYAEKSPLPLPAMQDTVLVLGTGPAMEKLPAIQNAYAVIRETARQLPGFTFVVKPHPRSDKTLWLTSDTPANVQVADPDADIDALLATAFVAVGSFTNAAIDCALQQRPFILVSEGDTDPQLDIHRMAPLCHSADKLAAAIAAIAAEPEPYRDNARAFTEYHLSNGFTGPEVIANHVLTMTRGKTPANTIPLTGRFP